MKEIFFFFFVGFQKNILGLKIQIVCNQVGGTLAITRSFGDIDLKQCVVADPYLTQTLLSKDDKFLILACDGLWDVISDQEAVDLVYKMSDPQKMSERLLEFAMANGTKDNVSIVVVIL